MLKLMSRFAVIGGIIASAFTFAPAAHADGYGCGGNLIDTYSIYTNDSSKILYGHGYLYYDSSTGKNCGAVVATTAGGYGISKTMYAGLVKCSDTSPGGSACTNVLTRDDDGPASYQYYAGPVTVTSPNNCITFQGTINYNGRSASFYAGRTHCG
ncbi:hypothetical protein [Streptomyces sp. NBC_01602]|uniref:hypothetical protein n=1 Tax=Streptomyces sp. NBC_01602 TaxID=2975893 RepID=UPI003866D106